MAHKISYLSQSASIHIKLCWFHPATGQAECQALGPLVDNISIYQPLGLLTYQLSIAVQFAVNDNQHYLVDNISIYESLGLLTYQLSICCAVNDNQ